MCVERRFSKRFSKRGEGHSLPSPPLSLSPSPPLPSPFQSSPRLSSPSSPTPAFVGIAELEAMHAKPMPSSVLVRAGVLLYCI